jgi:N-acyl-D-aspartate/D-glutamate deacylase
MIRVDRGMLEGRVLIASSEPHPECAGRDLSDIAAEWGALPAARHGDHFPDGRRRCAAHPGL